MDPKDPASRGSEAYCPGNFWEMLIICYSSDFVFFLEKNCDSLILVQVTPLVLKFSGPKC